MSGKSENGQVQLRIPDIDIGNDWPCSNDVLNRHEEIENLSPVLLNAQAPLVLAIDSPWGSGKTTFIKLWQLYLKTQNQVSLYLNAWESDFAEDPLLPMLSAFDDWLESKKVKSAPKKAWAKAKKYAPGVIKSSAVAAAKAATFGALDLDKEYEKLLADMAGKSVGNLVDSYKVKEELLGKFKSVLGDAMSALPDNQNNLIVFIDELDRCKPTYAIEMLERIKHLFDIDRVVFVLAINREQLSKSLQGIYGPNFDGSHYLKRFIDLDYQLQIKDVESYIQVKLNQDDLNEYFSSRRDGNNDFGTLSQIIKGVVSRFDYRLRDVEQLITRLRLILKSIPSSHNIDVAVLASLIVLREQNQVLYKQYVENYIYANEVIEFLMGRYTEHEKVPDYYAWVAGSLIRAGKDCYNESDLSSLIKPWETMLNSMDENDVKRHQIGRIIQIAQDNQGLWDRSNVRKTAFNRIELINRITIENN